MQTPRIEFNLDKIAHNVKVLKRLYSLKEIDILAVTKGVCGNTEIADVLVQSGIQVIGDSRISNLKKMRLAGVQAQFVLLRTPLISQLKSVVKYADISLNSELSVLRQLAKIAHQDNTIHKVILMVEMGDLREGLMPVNLEEVVRQVLRLKGLHLEGIGTNLTCFGGVQPDEKKMQHLSMLAENIERKFNIKLNIISGGNSANYNWFKSTKNIGRINNLRLGESILLGREALYRKPISGLFTDAFTLIAEVIESKIKPSAPYGKIGQNAFGKTPIFQDQGPMKRAILGLGLQDVLVAGLTPRMDIKILGSSSDHTILNTQNISLKVGDSLAFDLDYGALLSAMTSPYVSKRKEHIIEFDVTL